MTGRALPPFGSAGSKAPRCPPQRGIFMLGRHLVPVRRQPRVLEHNEPEGAVNGQLRAGRTREVCRRSQLNGLVGILTNEPIAGKSPRRSRRKPSREPPFPESVPNCSFPKWPIGDGETRKIALNEWPLSGAPIASLNVRVLGEAVIPTALSKRTKG